MKKFTIKEVKILAKRLGKWIIFDDCYESSHAKLKCQCIKCGYIHKISWREIKQNNGCRECNRRKKCLSIDYVKRKALTKGWIVLDNYYKNCKTKLNCLCLKEQHKHQIIWSDIQQGVGCSKCNKVSIKYIKSCAEKNGLLILNDVYVSSHMKFAYRCINGHFGEMSWSNIQKGRGCPECYGNKKLTIDYVKKQATQFGIWRVLDSNYKGAHAKLNCECVKHSHKYVLSWNHIQRGLGCPICRCLERTDTGYCRIWFDKVYREMILERDGYRCLNPDCWKNCNHLPLHRHHIDDNKKNCESENLITVCKSCNTRAQKDRLWHTAWYQAILNKRYGYNYQELTNAQ